MAKIKKFDSFVEAGPEMEKVAKVHVQQKQDEAVLAFNKAGKLRIADRYVLFLDKMPVGSAFVNINNGGMLALRELEVDKALHNKGIGTKFMEQLCDAADANGWTIVLTPDSYKGSSKSRLIEFYKRFGFVANHGRRKNYSIWEAMYRVPDNMKEHKIFESTDAEVKRAAHKAGYTIGPVYHGTDDEFTEFRPDKVAFLFRSAPMKYHFAYKKEFAERGGRPSDEKKKHIMAVYLKGEIDGHYDDDDNLIPPDADYVDIAGFMITVRNPEQIKSADTVTYDDSGKPIPLSKRFNSKKKDIRF